MRSLLKLVVFLLISLVVLILGNGFFTTFVSVRLDLLGTGTEMIGLITASYYAGILLASFLAPSWIKRYNHLRTWITLCAVNSVLILLHALWIDSLFWLFLRFVSGLVM